MSQEKEKEKARKYDEALERARKLNKEFPTICGINMCEAIFPELKESEDEKMWRLIKKYARANISDMALAYDHITREELVTWLEKQAGKESDPRYENLEELLAADDIYQMSMNDKMVQDAKEKAINALSGMCIGELLGLEKQNHVNYNTHDYIKNH